MLKNIEHFIEPIYYLKKYTNLAHDCVCKRKNRTKK